MDFITEKGVILIVSFIIIVFLPLKKIFGEEGNFTIKFVLFIVSFVFISVENVRNAYIEHIEQVNQTILFSEILVCLSLLFFIEKEARAKAFLYLLLIQNAEIFINNKTLIGMITNPQLSDLFILLSIGIIEYNLMELRVLNKLDDSL